MQIEKVAIEAKLYCSQIETTRGFEVRTVKTILFVSLFSNTTRYFTLQGIFGISFYYCLVFIEAYRNCLFQFNLTKEAWLNIFNFCSSVAYGNKRVHLSLRKFLWFTEALGSCWLTSLTVTKEKNMTQCSSEEGRAWSCFYMIKTYNIRPETP